MLLEEFIIVTGSVLISTFASFLIFIRFHSSPIIEARFFIIGSILFTLYFYSVLPVTILTDTSMTTFFIKLAPVFGHTGLFILSLSILLPTITTNSANYKNIFVLIFLSILMTATVIFNVQTINYTVSTHNYVVVNYQTTFSFLLLVANGISYIIVLIVRIHSVSKIFHEHQAIIEAQKRYILKFRFLFIYLILIIITLTSLILNRTVEQGTLPGFAWFIPVSIDYLYLSYAVYQDESFLFITTSSLEGIMISENKNNLVVYSEISSNQIEEDLFANILNAFNLTVKTKINTKRNLEQIIYGDKIIISFYGELVTTFLIVTQNNLVIQSIAKYLNNKFEKMFKPQIIECKETGIVVPQFFKGRFEDEVSYVRSFVPL